MNEDLRKLMDIQKYDKEIASLESELKRLEAKESRIRDVIETKESQIADVEEEIKEIEKDIRSKEDLLEETIDTLKKLEIKMGNVSTEKQLQAVNTEIDIAKTNKTVLEEKIEALKEELELKKKNLNELKDRYTQLLKTLDEYREKFNDRRSEIYSEIERINKIKEEIIPTINKKVLKKYERINKWAKGTAIVPVKKEACFGCFMKLTPQVLALLEETDEIVYCPNCGRMLYLEENDFTYNED